MTVDEPVLMLEIPTAAEYCGLRIAAGLSPMSESAAAIGLPASWCAVCLRQQGKLIGMGRIVGDGGLFLQIVDLAVEPSQQGRGLGKRIMVQLMEQLRQRAPADAIVTPPARASGDGRSRRTIFSQPLSAPRSQGMLLRM